MRAARFNFRKTLIMDASLAGNALMINKDALNNCISTLKKSSEADSKFFKLLPSFLYVKQQLVSDVVRIWLKTGLSLINKV